MPSRLKGIETMSPNAVRTSAPSCLNVPSRLKGIETKEKRYEEGCRTFES